MSLDAPGPAPHPNHEVFLDEEGDGGGHTLSGGQWQRAALARSVLREHADLLISHRLSTLRDADQIAVLGGAR